MARQSDPSPPGRDVLAAVALWRGASSTDAGRCVQGALRSLSGAAVDALAQEVGVPGVPCVLLDDVHEMSRTATVPP